MKILILIALLAPTLSLADASKVKKEAAEAVTATKEYANETREQFQTRMQENLKTVNNEIAELKQKAATSSVATKEKMRTKLDMLEVKRQELQKNLDQVKASSDKVWMALRQGITSAWQDLKTAVNKASSEIKSSKQ